MPIVIKEINVKMTVEKNKNDRSAERLFSELKAEILQELRSSESFTLSHSGRKKNR